MNYLAHFFLSYGDHELLTGQFIADAVKGHQHRSFPRRVGEGILLHRWIDSFTDNHPIVLELRSRFRRDLGLLTSPSIDIFFDHILARDWHRYNPALSLDEFAATQYTALENSPVPFPQKMERVLFYMKQHDWLTQYAQVQGIEQTFGGLSQRFRHGAGFALATKVLEDHTDIIGERFHEFFPLLDVASRMKLNTFAPGN